jgi:hypothetical protein
MRWNHTRLAHLPRPPAQMRKAVFERAGRQRFGLPTLKQRIDVLPFERAGAHLLETGFAQLTTGQRQRSQPVGLRRMTAIAVALAECS